MAAASNLLVHQVVTDVIMTRYLREKSELLYDARQEPVSMSTLLEAGTFLRCNGGQYVRAILMIADALMELHSHGIVHTNLHTKAVCFLRTASSDGSSAPHSLSRCVLGNFKRAVIASPSPDLPCLTNCSAAGHTAIFMDPSLVCLNLINDRTDVFALGIHMLHLLESSVGVQRNDLAHNHEATTMIDWYLTTYLREFLYGFPIDHVLQILDRRRRIRAAQSQPQSVAFLQDETLPFPEPVDEFEEWMREANTPVSRRIEACMRVLSSWWSVPLCAKVSRVILRCLHPMCVRRPRAAEVADMLREMHRFEAQFRAVSIFPEQSLSFRVPELSEWPEQLPTHVSARCFMMCRGLFAGRLATLQALEFTALSVLLIQWSRCWQLDKENGDSADDAARGMVHLAWLLYTRTVHETTEATKLVRMLSDPALRVAEVFRSHRLFLYLVTKPNLADRAKQLQL